MFQAAVAATDSTINGGISSSGLSASGLSASATESDSFNESFSDTITGPNGGTVSISGSLSGGYQFIYPDNSETDPDGSYSFDIDYALDLLAQLSNLGVTSAGDEYTLNGSFEVDSDAAVDMNFTISNNGASGSGTYSYNYGFNLAYGATIENVSQNVGGKFILFVSQRFGDSGSISDAEYLDDVTPTFTATLEVYNNSNQLIHSTSLSPSEVASVLPIVGDILLFS